MHQCLLFLRGHLIMCAVCVCVFPFFALRPVTVAVAMTAVQSNPSGLLKAYAAAAAGGFAAVDVDAMLKALKVAAGKGSAAGSGKSSSSGSTGGLLGLGMGLGRAKPLSAPLKEDYAAADFADLEVIADKAEKAEKGDGGGAGEEGAKARGIAGMFASLTRSKSSKYNS